MSNYLQLLFFCFLVYHCLFHSFERRSTRHKNYHCNKPSLVAQIQWKQEALKFKQAYNLSIQNNNFFIHFFFFSLDLKLNTTKTTTKLVKAKFCSFDQEIREKVNRVRSKPGKSLVSIWTHVTGGIVHIWAKKTSTSWPSVVVHVVTKGPTWAVCLSSSATSSRITAQLINSLHL